VLLLAMLVGLGASMAIAAYRTHVVDVAQRKAVWQQAAMFDGLRQGHLEDAVAVLAPTDDVERALPTLTLLAGLGEVDAALRETYEAGLAEPAIPFAPASLEHVTLDRDVAFSGDGQNRLVLVRRDGDWFVDPRPFIDDDLNLAAAEAMRAELRELAGRVRAGEFTTHADAVAAYESAAIRGLLRSMMTTRPSDG
jgi:hypothetical protein